MAICYAFLRAIGIYTAALAKKTPQTAIPLLSPVEFCLLFIYWFVTI